jgi:hypothetical protein
MDNDKMEMGKMDVKKYLLNISECGDALLE